MTYLPFQYFYRDFLTIFVTAVDVYGTVINSLIASMILFSCSYHLCDNSRNLRGISGGEQNDIVKLSNICCWCWLIAASHYSIVLYSTVQSTYSTWKNVTFLCDESNLADCWVVCQNSKSTWWEADHIQFTPFPGPILLHIIWVYFYIGSSDHRVVRVVAAYSIFWRFE